MIPWSKINDWDLKEEIQKNWEKLLKNPTNKEEEYQKYLSKFNGFFFPKRYKIDEQIILEKIKFGAYHTSDFVSISNARSYGFNYTLIELESPHTPPFNKDGNPSSRLKNAVQQIMDWKMWINNNLDEAKRLFPSKLFKINNIPNFNYLIVIGNRENSSEMLHKRNYYSQQVGIEIRSFDFFTDIIKKKEFSSFTYITNDIIAPSEEENNTFTNPFSLPYSDSIWRKIVNNHDFEVSHIISKNIKHLLKYRNYNEEYLNRFMKFLSDNGYDSIDKSEYEILKLS